MKQRLAQVAEVALGRQRAPQYEQGANLVPYLRSANVVDGALDLSDVKEMNFSPAEQKIYSLQDGDVLVTEGSGSRETVGTSVVWRGEISGTVCFQNTLLRLRPRPGRSDGRYLGWWMRHAHAAGMVAKETRGANIQHLGAESLRGMESDFPDLDVQRRVADFLDDQVSRIDEAVRLRREQVEAVLARGREQVEAVLVENAERHVPLKYMTLKIGSGKTPSGGAEAYVDDGVAFLRSQNVHFDGLRLDEVAYIDYDTDREMSGTRVVSDDVLLNITGASMGRCAVFDADIRANVNQHVCIIRLKAPALASIVAAGIGTRLVQDQIRVVQVGGNRDGLNFEQVGALHVPLPTDDDADRIRRDIEQVDRITNGAAREMTAQIDLLQERKRSLITAAVTGEFDVTTASGRGV